MQTGKLIIFSNQIGKPTAFKAVCMREGVANALSIICNPIISYLFTDVNMNL